MDITCRKAERKDAKTLQDFMEQLVQASGDIEKLEEQIEKIHANDMYYLCVACAQEKVIGTAMGILCEDICEQCQRFMVVENVFVSAEYRGKQIAAHIFSHLEEWAKKHNAYYSILVSENTRERAHRFYHKVGYKKMGGFKKLY